MATPSNKTSEAQALQHVADITRLMQDEGITMTAAIAELGLTKMSVMTNWPRMYPSVAVALERARDLRQGTLERWLYDIIKGTGKGKGSAGAAIFALTNCNRASGDWKNSNYSETRHIVEEKVDLSKYSEEELLQLQKLIDKETGVIEVELDATPHERAIVRRD